MQEHKVPDRLREPLGELAVAAYILLNEFFHVYHPYTGEDGNESMSRRYDSTSELRLRSPE